eukprot:scaffold22978_cov68-Phaeocystis_antarctica.AAC.9
MKEADDTLAPLADTIASACRGRRTTCVLAHRERAPEREAAFYAMCRARGLAVVPCGAEARAYAPPETEQQDPGCRGRLCLVRICDAETQRLAGCADIVMMLDVLTPPPPGAAPSWRRAKFTPHPRAKSTRVPSLPSHESRAPGQPHVRAALGCRRGSLRELARAQEQGRRPHRQSGAAPVVVRGCLAVAGPAAPALQLARALRAHSRRRVHHLVACLQQAAAEVPLRRPEECATAG